MQLVIKKEDPYETKIQNIHSIPVFNFNNIKHLASIDLVSDLI